MRRVICAVCIVTFLNAIVFARPIQIYDYKRLFKEADIVVIAIATKTTPTSDKEMGEDYQGRNTEFSIRQTLKGEAPDNLNVLHFKYVGEIRVDNAAHLVDFVLHSAKDNMPLMFEFQTPEYMLFLKRMEDGRYQPVSGYDDPAFSVRKITVPPEVEKQKTAK